MVGRRCIVASLAVALIGSNGVRFKKKDSTSRSCGVKGSAYGASVNNEVNMSIVNGDDANECEWSWQVGLWKKNFPFCGGTLIDPSWVLTAAHCMNDKDFIVKAGDWKFTTTSKNQQSRDVEDIYYHPKYDSSTFSHDFALVKLQSPFSMSKCVGLACLPEQDVIDGSECWISGWGLLSTNGYQPATMQEAPMKVMSNKDCVDRFDHRSSDIDDSMICAVGQKRGKITDACQGDSGGPMVCKTDGTWYINGVTSWGYDCADEKFPGIWSRVYNVVDWIEETMSSPSGTPPPQECPGMCEPEWCMAPACSECAFCR